MTMMSRNTDSAVARDSQGANGAAHLRDVSGDPSVSGDVVVHGVLEEVSWRTRTARLYTEDDTAVTVRFTAEQDGWMRLVANYPVQVHGIARYDATGELEEVDLVRLRARDEGWQTYDIADQLAVFSKDPLTVADIEPIPGIDWDELMQAIRDDRAQKPW